MNRWMTLVAATALGVGTAAAQDVLAATATLTATDGSETGSVEVNETESGLLHVVVTAEGISPGVHGVHVHETGDCSAADFTSAGGHLAGEAQHGIRVADGPHPGDLPNAHVQDDGTLAMEVFAAGLTMEMISDEDGSAVVIHAGADDYASQPAGDAGDRIACGVIQVE